ncbi:hypothetical protein [Luteibacter sp.]|uniref:hypothetical protein n=1 Tax=Luteibacter sp. TaxID=1886636 RepID=UPI00280A3912|nr:hypothetical protein [Luteibacter sp.]MDQ8050720.1 hypothetical protein [Luteibacter sp.]
MSDCSHNWHDYGQHAGKNLSFCVRCEMISATGYEGVPYGLPKATPQPVTPAGGEVVVCTIGDYRAVRRMMATVLYDDMKIAECYTDDDAKFVGAAILAYTHPPVADAALLERAERLHSAIVDAISIHGSFNTTADMADWLHDELVAALNQRGGGNA